MGTAGYTAQLTIDAEIVGIAKDVDLTGNAEMAETSVRSDDGWKTFLQSLKDWASAITQLWVPTEAALDAILDAWVDGTAIACRVADTEYDTTTQWAASTAKAVGDLVIIKTGTSNWVYECTSYGSAPHQTAAVEPSWPTTAGETVVDGDITWTCRAGAKGFYGDVLVKSVKKGEPLAGAQTLDVQLQGTGALARMRAT